MTKLTPAIAAAHVMQGYRDAGLKRGMHLVDAVLTTVNGVPTVKVTVKKTGRRTWTNANWRVQLDEAGNLYSWN